MKYTSTRGGGFSVTAAEAIVAGLAPDGGLFVPDSFPQFSMAAIAGVEDYVSCATTVLAAFLPEFSEGELRGYVEKAYAFSRFPVKDVAPVVQIKNGVHVLELFHGPTCAFKDFALQLLPYLMTASMQKTGVEKTVVILTATSGDTGKAAMEGFADVPGTKILVFYPHGGTSNIQRLQMTTQTGGNVAVFAAKGSFDDAQTGVKRIFTDKDFAAELDEKGFLLSSANSINWGRLVPQIVYYFWAYSQLLRDGKIKAGEPINITVPTGNFGNILAAYFAMQCGLPVKKLICASNQNNVLTDFIKTGRYDRNRAFYLTASPSMDILVSSNLERLLYLLCGRNGGEVRGYMESLANSGEYTVAPEVLAALQKDFAAGYADDAQTGETIGKIKAETGYLCDTHTAVGLKVHADYTKETGDNAPALIAATASPFKFAASVLPAIGKDVPADDFAQLEALEQVAGMKAPAALSQLKGKPERFTEVLEPEDMKKAVWDMLTNQHIEG